MIRLRVVNTKGSPIKEILAPSYRMTHRRAQMKPEVEERYPRGRSKFKRE